MTRPTVVGRLVADLIERGKSRNDVAAALNIQPPSVTMIKHGRASLDDSKIGLLADLHGGYTAEQIKAMKYIEWLEREKGISPHVLLSVLGSA